MAILELIFLTGVAVAQRPTEGGFFSFSETDTIVTHDFEQVRVHYSVEGPNQTILTDNDNSGVPDFVELVASVSMEAIDHFDALGFKFPLTEFDLGLGELGGSSAYDWYLVDFGGSADGQFGVDACDGELCSGYMVIENDFYGYGYPTREQAVRTLVSHEYFHAIQAAYHASRGDWLSEGTAVWAEHSFDDSLSDFYWLCSAYLEDTQRSINRPPAGALSTFSYGTGLFYAFLVEQHGTESMVILQEVLSDVLMDDLGALEEAIIQMDGNLAEDWITFAKWNLATHYRSGAMPGYPYADSLFGLEAESEGSLIFEDHRFYPLASSYFRIDHAGGDLQFTAFEETSGVKMSLHPVAEGAADGPVLPAIEQWSVDGPMSVGWTLPAGGYWLVGSYPETAEQSEKFEFCLGDISVCSDADPSDTSDASSNPTSSKESGCQYLQLRSVWFGWVVLFLSVQRRRFEIDEPSIL